MSIFNELLPKLNEISNAFTKNFSDDLKTAFQSLDKFEAELNARRKTRDQSQKDKNQAMALQSIHEEEDATSKTPEERRQPKKPSESPDRGSKKRSKHEVDGMESPEVEKRPKRNASARAQIIISDQINLKLSKKIRRETSTQKRRRRKDDDKENYLEPIVQVKLEKISLPPEPKNLEMLPMNGDVNQEVTEEAAMPPPPVPKQTRKKVDKTEEVIEEETTRRQTLRTRKQTDMLPPPASRDSRTRRPRNKARETSTTESEKETTAVENEIASPAEKPLPKRTKRTRKASEKKEIKKEMEKPESENEEKSSKECLSERYAQSPVLQKVKPKATKQKVNETQNTERITEITHLDETDTVSINNNMEKTQIISQLNCTVTIEKMKDATVVLSDHEPAAVRQMNETVVLEERPKEKIMNATVVIQEAAGGSSHDISSSSLITDDDSHDTSDTHRTSATPTTPATHAHSDQPTSAVKVKVQQFEEMASRVTRTKTRAMAKKEEPSESHTPSDKSQPAITMDTLSKMNNMIFNGKPPMISSSMTKPRTNIPLKCVISSSTSKLSVNKVQEEERTEKEDARRKKEALLEAKRELQRSKREQKMSAAAQARSAADSSRRAALRAAADERRQRQALADQGRAHRLRDAERRRLEHARKAAETDERRRHDEAARAQRRAHDQARAEAARRRQREEASAVKREAAMAEKEIERRQKEFMERMKMKQRMESDRVTPHKQPGAPVAPMEPVYMQDGFQHLNSDEEEPPERPAPLWSTSKVRRDQLQKQCLVGSLHVDRLFSVREHSPDLREIFPNIERARLKRTSSAVWRTPPRLPPLHE